MKAHRVSAWRRELPPLLVLVLFSFLVALGLHVFVYKADFAPSGVDGIAAMLQYLSETSFGYKINAGLFTLAINLPLLIVAWFILKRRYVLYTLLYTLVVSLSLLLLDAVGFYQYDCTVPGNGTSPLIAAIFGGVAQGLTGMILRLGGSSGGVDIVGCLIQRRMPHRDLEKVIAWVSYATVAIAFFVYGNLNSVCLSVISIFACERVSAAFLRSRRNAVKLEIVTDSETADRFRHILLYELGHGATLLEGRGMYTAEAREVIVCLIPYRDLPTFLKLVRPMEGTFLYYSDVLGVRGNFDYDRPAVPPGQEGRPLAM